MRRYTWLVFLLVAFFVLPFLYPGSWTPVPISAQTVPTRVKTPTPTPALDLYLPLILRDSAVLVVTSMTAGVYPTSANSCPAVFLFFANITANGMGTATYRWERSDSTSSSTKSIIFNGMGPQTISDTWSLGGSGVNYSGWERVHVITPNDVASNQAIFTLSCQ